MVISPQEIVKKYNISYQTLNYYTALGLLKVCKRKGNARLYSQGEVGKNLKKVTELKNKGYPLRLICRMI